MEDTFSFCPRRLGEHQARPRLCLPAGENREPSNLGNHVFRKAARGDPPPSSIKATAVLQAHGIRVRWVEQSGDWGRGPERVSHHSRSHSPPAAWERTGLGCLGTAHLHLLSPQFLRNSLKKTRGSNWSLRLSKELNNQIESFDSPSLEKVCPHSVKTVQTGKGHQGQWDGVPHCG